MSTRSLVGRPAGDGIKGRYVHSDGYASHMGYTLWELIKRDGVDTVARVLLDDHYGWSHLGHDQPDITGVEVNPNASWGTYEYGTPEYVAWSFQSSYGDGRFANVPGYGVAYTDTVIDTMPGEKGYQQIREEDWHTCKCPDNPSDCDPLFLEWAYSIGPMALTVLKSVPSTDRQYVHVHVATVAYDTGIQPDWGKIGEAGNEIAEAWHAKHREVKA